MTVVVVQRFVSKPLARYSYKLQQQDVIEDNDGGERQVRIAVLEARDGLGTVCGILSLTCLKNCNFTFILIPSSR